MTRVERTSHRHPCPALKIKDRLCRQRDPRLGAHQEESFPSPFLKQHFFCSGLRSPFEPDCLLSNCSELFPCLPQQRGLFTAQLPAAGNGGVGYLLNVGTNWPFNCRASDAVDVQRLQKTPGRARHKEMGTERAPSAGTRCFPLPPDTKHSPVLKIPRLGNSPSNAHPDGNLLSRGLAAVTCCWDGAGDTIWLPSPGIPPACPAPKPLGDHGLKRGQQGALVATMPSASWAVSMERSSLQLLLGDPTWGILGPVWGSPVQDRQVEVSKMEQRTQEKVALPSKAGPYCR